MINPFASQQQAIANVIAHFYRALPAEDRGAFGDYKLHKSLQFCVCTAHDRLLATFGEVTHKDIILVAEAWLMSRYAERPKPLRRKGEVE